MTNSKVSVILATYSNKGENQRYLDLCLNSLQRQSYQNIEVILISSGDYVPTTPDWVKLKHYPQAQRHHFPAAINLGVTKADPNTTHYLLLNDDTIVTRNTIQNLVARIGDSELVLQPISNCDNFVKYNLLLGWEKHGEFIQSTQRFYRYDELAHSAEWLEKAGSLYPPGLITQDWVAFYCTLIPKKVWDKVGTLDGNLRTGCDDADYCYRAKKMGIYSAVELSSLVWHFGGTSADLHLTPEDRKFNYDYFLNKWGRPQP